MYALVVFSICAVIVFGGVFGIILSQSQKRKKATELRGFPIEGDPNVDPRSANEP